MNRQHQQIDAALAAIREALEPSSILGAYLYGSAVASGLRPDSDLDLFLLTSRRLRREERQRLVDGMMPISRRSRRPAGWRPLELTLVAQPDVRPWRYPPTLDLQYGEWLSDEKLHAEIEQGRSERPDVAVLITMVRAKSRPLIGPPAPELLDDVPLQDLMRAMVDELPQLLGDLETDTRNVLLTLARMWCSVVTGDIRSKDAAADWAIERLPSEHRPLMVRARDLYRNGGYGEWESEPRVRRFAEFMVTAIMRR